MDSLSCGMPARFQKSDEITVNNPHSTPAIGHVQREIAVTLRRNVGHALVKSPVTITRNTQGEWCARTTCGILAEKSFQEIVALAT
jgi:isocitrate dehydrogenase